MRRPKGGWSSGEERSRRGREQGSRWDGTQCEDCRKSMKGWR